MSSAKLKIILAGLVLNTAETLVWPYNHFLQHKYEPELTNQIIAFLGSEG